MHIKINNLFKLILIVTLFFSKEIFSLEIGKWDFKIEQNWCYIGSIPINEEGDYELRGDTYLIVYKINKQPESTIQINAGYEYAEKEIVEIIIDQASFELFSQGDSAWSKNQDDEIIYAMKTGMNMIVRGISLRGTLTTDTYTLVGFTSAYNKLEEDC